MSTTTSLIAVTVDAGTAARAEEMTADVSAMIANVADGTLPVQASVASRGVDVVAVALHTVQQVPTYHGITYAQCFRCGYGTADTATLETWNDLTGECPSCVKPGRILWVLTGGRVSITDADAAGLIGSHDLRLGNTDGTPPDAPGAFTGPEPGYTVHDMPMGGCSTSAAHYAHLDAGSTVCENAGVGPELASADDVIAGRARYADTAGGHADRRILADRLDVARAESRAAGYR